MEIWKVEIVEVGKKYLIIYDDKGFKPVKKIGTIVWLESPLFRLDSKPHETLNLNNIIRAEEVRE